MTEMRYELAIERIENIKGENTVSEKYRDYFRTLADFALLVDKLKEKIERPVIRSLFIPGNRSNRKAFTVFNFKWETTKPK